MFLDPVLGPGGDVRFYFGLENGEGKERECTDFSDSKNFPTSIVKAIKAGEMRGLAEPPTGLLMPSVYAKWGAKYGAVNAKWSAERDAVNAKWGTDLIVVAIAAALCLAGAAVFNRRDLQAE